MKFNSRLSSALLVSLTLLLICISFTPATAKAARLHTDPRWSTDSSAKSNPTQPPEIPVRLPITSGKLVPFAVKMIWPVCKAKVSAAKINQRPITFKAFG